MTGRIKQAVVLGVLALVLGAFFAPDAVTAQEPEQERRETVTVAANKEVDVEPDVGTVELGVKVHGRSAEQATDKLTNRTRRVIDAIEGAGFTDDEISTYGVRLQRVCLSDCRDPNPKDDKVPEPVMGYRGTSGIRIETGQLDRLGEVIDVGIRAGANSVRGVSFDVEDRSEAVKEALKQAMQFATDKAKILAETGGRQLGPAIQITEGRTRAPREYDYAYPQASSVAGTASGGSGGGGGGGEPNPFPIEPPTLSASATVQVTYALN